MKFNDKYNISNEFNDIFAFNDENEELEHEAKMLMFKFLEEVENLNITGKKLKKKELAEALGKSPSFISQLYSGDKILNFNHLAKIQKVFNINFEIKAHDNTLSYKENDNKIKIKNFQKDSDGFWVWMNKKPDYSKQDNCCEDFSSTLNEITAA